MQLQIPSWHELEVYKTNLVPDIRLKEKKIRKLAPELKQTKLTTQKLRRLTSTKIIMLTALTVTKILVTESSSHPFIKK